MDTNVLILSGGSVSADLMSIFGEIASGMIPLKQRPAIHWIINNLLRNKFKTFYISVGFKGETVENYVNGLKHPVAKFGFVHVDHRKPPGNSIKQFLDENSISKDLLVVLGDTLIFENLELKEDTIFSSRDFLFPDQYSSVQKDASGYLKEIKEKGEKKSDEDEAIIGLYYFADVALLRSELAKLTNANIQISDILKAYNQTRKFRVKQSTTWLDLGHLDKYYNSRVSLSQARFFNSLEYNSLLGVITKRSKNKEKFRDEIEWYLKLPKSIQVLAPRVFDYSVGEDPFITMEYYSYPTLAELFIYGNHGTRLWDQIFQRIFSIMDIFRSSKSHVADRDFHEIYLKKTYDRIEVAQTQSSVLAELFSYQKVTINGEKYVGLPLLLKKIEEHYLKLVKEKELFTCFIHGDLCCSNILFDVSSGILRVIDPRGKWGSSPYGDIRYDLAKLRHSICSGYDFIVNDLFDLSRNLDSISLNIHDTVLHKEIALRFDNKLTNVFDMKDILFIEGLLFISMIPLHSDVPERQIAMFTQGIKLLNSSLIGIHD